MKIKFNFIGAIRMMAVSIGFVFLVAIVVFFLQFVVGYITKSQPENTAIVIFMVLVFVSIAYGFIEK